MKRMNRREFLGTSGKMALGLGLGMKSVAMAAENRGGQMAVAAGVGAGEQSLKAAFADPPREFGVMPLWFWNGDMTEEESLRQLREFHAKGFGGWIPHPRLGMSRQVGYLTDEYFRLLKVLVEETRRLGMKVVLYDEGCYPSGSAQGRVVAENPEYASRCIIAVHRQVKGPAAGYWRPSPGRALQDKLVCVVLGRETAPNTLDPDSMKLLPVQEPGLVRYEVPEGDWRMVSVWNVMSGGTIRGVFAEEDDHQPLAPAAGNILDPDAVACFIRHTHDQYYKHLKEYFGTTILAMFTDEPGPLGRAPRRGPEPKAFTEGFLDDLQANWNDDVKRWLPAMWLDCGPRTVEFRGMYGRTVHERLERVFYAAQSKWCEDHGIALTGHPGGGGDMASLRHFQWPGQDIVWRGLLPGNRSGIEGGRSVLAKGPSSAQAVRGSRRSTTEALGAYGWQLTMDEAKWVLDWHAVRGINTYFLHAAFYSIEGRRAYESQPCIAVQNVWWPYFGLIGEHIRRVSWLITDGTTICDVAILTEPKNVAWAAAKELTLEQIDFFYLDSSSLERTKINNGRLEIGSQKFRAVICDPQNIATPADKAKLAEFERAGGLVIEKWEPENLISRIVAKLGRDVDWLGAKDLRVLHYRKDGHEFYLMVNEGEEPIEGEFTLASTGSVELWDPMDGSTRPWPASISGGRTKTYLRLERRQAMVLAIDPKGKADPKVELPLIAGDVVSEIRGPWKAMDSAGRIMGAPCPGDWARVRDLETFTGTIRFATEFMLPKGQEGKTLFLDLGKVGDIAEVLVNGQPVGVRGWAPHVLEVGRVCKPGVNTLEVRVTNSMANKYDGLQMLSGIMGPVVLRSAKQMKN